MIDPLYRIGNWKKSNRPCGFLEIRRQHPRSAPVRPNRGDVAPHGRGQKRTKKIDNTAALKTCGTLINAGNAPVSGNCSRRTLHRARATPRGRLVGSGRGGLEFSRTNRNTNAKLFAGTGGEDNHSCLSSVSGTDHMPQSDVVRQQATYRARIFKTLGSAFSNSPITRFLPEFCECARRAKKSASRLEPSFAGP